MMPDVCTADIRHPVFVRYCIYIVTALIVNQTSITKVFHYLWLHVQMYQMYLYTEANLTP